MTQLEDGTAGRTHWHGSEEAPATREPAVGYGGYAPRPAGLFPISRGIVDVTALPVPLQHVFDEFDQAATQPFVGLTSNGEVVPGLYPLQNTGISTAPIVDAANRYLSLLDAEQREQAVRPVNSPAWRAWINAFAPRPPTGVLLDAATPTQREAALSLFETALSPQGFTDLRTAMRINAALAHVAQGYEDTLREYMYWVTIFGEPSVEHPWGIQLFGHHAAVNIFITGSQLTIGPMFLGAEPRVVVGGTNDGLRAFDDERALALALMHSLSIEQRKTAVLSASIRWDDLPPELAHPTEGRMRGSVGRDNAIVPLDGLSASTLSEEQRGMLRSLIVRYIGRIPEEHARIRMAQVDEYLDETHFAWVGDVDPEKPFYYKVQSPVVFIELDCHSGIFLSNDDPEPFHVHTIMRTPNGNDYGRAWLQEYERGETPNDL
jgi:hypothetical protein